jgi:hypothetical protein
VPRPSKPARLRLEGAAQGRPAVWYIIDGRKRLSTGCGQGDPRGAERQLAAYIAQQHAAPRSERAAIQLPVADSLGIDAADWEQGFMHEDRGFFDRQRAKLCARISGQLQAETPHAELFSEDVW